MSKTLQSDKIVFKSIGGADLGEIDTDVSGNVNIIATGNISLENPSFTITIPSAAPTPSFYQIS
jgi:hypothetical protein